jgi:DNA repair and recombination protein RAD52
MFTTEQIAALTAPLDKSNVKSRAQAGRQLSYIEGWKAIEEANRIFGFGAWDRETVEIKQLGEPREVEGKYRVAYMARVRVTVREQVEWVPHANQAYPKIIRDGCGYGSGIDRDLGSAHESAIKEAETDAMKRALMTFGNPFGLALYDKEQRNVSDEAAPAPKRVSAVPTNPPLPEGMEPKPAAGSRLVADALIIALKKAQTPDALKAWWADKQTQNNLIALPEADLARVKEAKAVRWAELTDGVPAHV